MEVVQTAPDLRQTKDLGFRFGFFGASGFERSDLVGTLSGFQCLFKVAWSFTGFLWGFVGLHKICSRMLWVLAWFGSGLRVCRGCGLSLGSGVLSSGS